MRLTVSFPTLPQDLTALYGQARAFDHLGSYKDAVASYSRVNRVEPSCERAFFYKGFAHILLHQYDEAVDAFARTLEINPENAEAWQEKGKALVVLEKFESAVEAFDGFLVTSAGECSHCL